MGVSRRANNNRRNRSLMASAYETYQKYWCSVRRQAFGSQAFRSRIPSNATVSIIPIFRSESSAGFGRCEHVSAALCQAVAEVGDLAGEDVDGRRLAGNTVGIDCVQCPQVYFPPLWLLKDLRQPLGQRIGSLTPLLADTVGDLAIRDGQILRLT
jgi:hypothetical protein